MQVTQQKIEALAHGITVDGVKYRPIRLVVLNRLRSNTWVEATLTEGKNRELRRVFGHMNWQVSRLIRIAFGPYSLGDLQPGAVLAVPLRPELRSWCESHGLIAPRAAQRNTGDTAAPITTPTTNQEHPSRSISSSGSNVRGGHGSEPRGTAHTATTIHTSVPRRS